MRILALVVAGSVALAGTGCTLVGAGTGALTGSAINHSIDPASPHRIRVGIPTFVGAAVGIICDIAILTAISQKSDPLRPFVLYPADH
jgi:hypothetical protein